MRALVATLALFLVACSDQSPSQINAPQQITRASDSAVLSVHDGWAPPTPGGVDVSAGYLTISNPTAVADTLVSVSSARAERVEVHEMSMANGVMQMRPMARLTIPAGGEVMLAPSGKHLMFYGVRQPFVQGETVAVHLTFANGGEMDVSLPVRRNGAGDSH